MKPCYQWGRNLIAQTIWCPFALILHVKAPNTGVIKRLSAGRILLTNRCSLALWSPLVHIDMWKCSKSSEWCSFSSGACFSELPNWFLSLHSLAIPPPLNWDIQHFLNISKSIKGKCTPNQNWAHFVHFLKIINTFLKIRDRSNTYLGGTWCKTI